VDKKAGNYKHGYKMHNGVDRDSGLITSNKTTTAKAHDVTVGNDLLHGDEEEVLGDSGYINIHNHRNALAERKYSSLRPKKSLFSTLSRKFRVVCGVAHRCQMFCLMYWQSLPHDIFSQKSNCRD